jgi:CubicO group peptidase (beta-lactamase class C family)
MFAKTVTLLLPLVTISILSIYAEADAQGHDALEEQLDRIIGQFLESHAIPGLAVGIVKENKVVYAKGFGVVELGADTPVTPQSLFHTASLSKTFVATAIMQLVEQDRLDLDASVAKYLPYFTLDDERTEQITVRQLLTHTSGMPDVKDYHWDKPDHDAGALERYVRSLENQKLIAPPGQRYEYSNMAYEVLGDVIAKVSGKPFETYVRERIFDPLEMRNSTFFKPATDAGFRTTPHTGRRKPKISPIYPYNRAHAPSSTLHSSVEELCHWIIANVNRGHFKDRHVLQEGSFDEIWKPQAEGRRGMKIGLAWMLAERPYGRLVFHGGRDIGFGSHVTLLPDTRGGLIILTNTSDFPVPLLRNAIMKAAFGETGR